MKLINLFIPKDKAQVVSEVESWSVCWFTKTGWANEKKQSAKVFTNKKDAVEFEKQLNESAKFIGCWIEIRLSKN